MSMTHMVIINILTKDIDDSLDVDDVHNSHVPPLRAPLDPHPGSGEGPAHGAGQVPPLPPSHPGHLCQEELCLVRNFCKVGLKSEYTD